MMFPSTASSHSGSGFWQGTQEGDAFAPKTLWGETVFGSPIGMANNGGTSTSIFCHTSPSSSTTFGARSSSVFGPSFAASGSSQIHPLGSSSSNLVKALLVVGLGATFLIKKKSDVTGQERGSRIAGYKRTPEAAYSAKKLVSISAMPAYEAKSHEELRWEDCCNLSEKGGLGSSSLASGLTTLISSTPIVKTFPSVSTTWKYPGPKCTPFSSQPLQISPSANTFVPSNPFISRTNLTSAAASTTVSTAPLFNPFIRETPPAFAAASTGSLFSLPPLKHNPFINPSTSLPTHTSSTGPRFEAFTGVIDRKPSSLNHFWATPIAGPFLCPVTAAANSSLVSPGFNKPTTTALFNPSAAQNCNRSKTGIICQTSAESQLSSTKPACTATATASPFGTLPPNPHYGTLKKRSIQYGISSIPVKDKPDSVKHSLLTSRHLSGRMKLPVRKYGPKLNATKMPYFSDTEDIPIASYIPRENPRALLVCPEKWPLSTMVENERGKAGDPTDEKQSSTTAILDVPSKLKQPDYYTRPQISELEAKEQAGPGFCRRVKDFVVGRHGYGSIKFLGETDVTNIDIESEIQFNNREVIVYMDDTKKPPVGEGLNKPAEITLLNVKCIDKETGMQYTDGSKVNKYIVMLKKKAVAQGAEFMSYDPVEGEWKFRVQHF